MNNEHDFEYKLKAIQRMSLSNTEREEMRANVRRFMIEHPVRASLTTRLFSGFSISGGSHVMRPVLAGFLVVFVVGTGTSYAAGNALPGDTLYAFKVNVNENITRALAVTAEARANHEAALAVRRIEEAEVLAAEGRLTAEARAEIENRFQEHAERFEERAITLAREESAVAVVADIQSDFEASLKAHASVLTELSSLATEIHNEITPVTDIVAARVATIEHARIATERAIAKKSSEDIRVAATEKKRAVERELSDTKRTRVTAVAEPEADTAVMMMAVSVPTEVTATTDSDPETDFEEGSAHLEEGEYGEAFGRFQKAARTIRQERLKLDVRERLKLDQVRNVIEE